MKKNDYPQIQVTLIEPTRKNDLYTWEFWCPFCKTYHIHGTGSSSFEYVIKHLNNLGHRIAHCHSINSPFREHGYYLVLSKKEKLRIKKLSQ